MIKEKNQNLNPDNSIPKDTESSEKDAKKEKIAKLFLEYDKTRDPKIREKLIVEHLYIAEILAKKYINRGIEYDDLYQVASMGLIFAMDRYDISKGYEFSSFATPTIVGEIKRYFRDKGWVIRVPRRIQELSKKVNQARIHLSQIMQKQPTVTDIAEEIGITEEEVLEAMEASKVYAPESLNKTIDTGSDDKEVNLGDLIGEDDRNFDKVDFYDVVSKQLKTFNDLEKKIFVYRYYDKRTQISIAEELKISQMTVSRIEKKIIQKFREEFDLKPSDFRK